MKKIEPSNGPLRVALYIRVSGEEQKIKGLSLRAQEERLVAYAKEKGWVITGTYIDAAKTARKNMQKRSEFQRMLESVRRNEIDLLLFCRLDRWFRSVADYYKVMEVLDAHKCGWKTIDEDYDTSTASGRLYINMKLSIAQNEADIDAERISVVFDSKIQNGTILSGQKPFWLRATPDKHLELIPEQVAILQEAYNYFEYSTSKLATVKHIREMYGINWCESTINRALTNKLAIGVYDSKGRYNPDFCPAAISTEQFERVQALLPKNSKNNPKGRIYIFTGVLVCDECGRNLAGYTTKNFRYYRCAQHFKRDTCRNNRSIREDKIEEWLFQNLETEIKNYEIGWEIRAAKQKRLSSGNDSAALKRKLVKLKELYVNDLIDIDEYKKDYEKYTAALEDAMKNQVKEKPIDLSTVRKIISNDFKELYNTFSREEKRALWKSTIKEIRVDSNREVTGISFF